MGETFGEHPETNAVLMENHGLVACGLSMASASIAVNLELYRASSRRRCGHAARASGEEVMGVSRRLRRTRQPAGDKVT